MSNLIISTSQQVCAFCLTLCLFLQGCRAVSQEYIEQSSVFPQPSATPSQNRQLFGIGLGPSAQALLNDVESLYGKKVIELDNTNGEVSDLGDAGSNVLPDGTPVISLNNKLDKNEGTMVHELFHLKLFAQGFSTPPGIRIGDNGKTFDTSLFVQLVMALVYSPLQHSIFFPEMRRMGFDPDKEQRNTVLKAIQEKKFEFPEKMSLTDKDRLIAMYYFQFSMHFTDKKLLSMMTKLFKTAGWIKSLQMGEAMVRIARTNYPYTPQSLIDTFISCLNILYDGERLYTFAGWVSRTETPLVTRVAVLNLISVSQR